MRTLAVLLALACSACIEGDGNGGERWREALPHAGVVELPVGHWPQEEAPDEVVAAVRRFLKESAPRRSDSP